MATKKAFQGENYKKSGEYVGNYNGGRSEVQEMASTLKRRNVRAMAGNSSYIGKRVLLIHNNDLEKATKALKEFYPKHYATELAANLKRDVETDKKMGVFEGDSDFKEMKNLTTFELFEANNPKVLSKEDQEQVEYYIEKYGQKMSGSTEQTAANWIDGITELSDDAKRAIWAGIKADTKKESGARDMPEWINESLNEDEARISLTEDDFRKLVSGEIITPESFPPHLGKLKIALQDIGWANMIRIIQEASRK